MSESPTIPVANRPCHFGDLGVILPVYLVQQFSAYRVRSDFIARDVVGAIELSRAAYRKMIQNLVWATAYNIVAIQLAAGLSVGWGVDLPMSVGAVAMSLSTIIVAVNAQLLQRLKLRFWD